MNATYLSSRTCRIAAEMVERRELDAKRCCVILLLYDYPLPYTLCCDYPTNNSRDTEIRFYLTFLFSLDVKSRLKIYVISLCFAY